MNGTRAEPQGWQETAYAILRLSSRWAKLLPVDHLEGTGTSPSIIFLPRTHGDSLA